MSTRVCFAWFVSVSFAIGAVVIGEAQVQASKRVATSSNVAATTKSLTDLAEQAKKYETLLSDVDVKSDPDIRSAVYQKWVAATCQIKRVKLQQTGVADESLAAAIYSACTRRLSAQEETSLTPQLPVTKPDSAHIPQPITAAPSSAQPSGSSPQSDTSCPSRTTFNDLAIPTLAAVGASDVPTIIGTVEVGTLPKGTKASVQVCFKPSAMGNKKTTAGSGTKTRIREVVSGGSPETGTLIGYPGIVNADGSFTVTGKSKVSARDQLFAQLFLTDEAGTKTYGPVSAAFTVGSCSQTATKGAALTLGATTDANGKITYKLQNAKSGTIIRICVDDQEVIPSVTVNADGTLVGAANTIPTNSGDVVAVQAVTDGKPSGPLSNKVVVGKCSGATIVATDPSMLLSLDPTQVGGAVVSGTAKSATDGSNVRVCVADLEVARGTIDHGQFKVALPAPLQSGQSVSAQEIVSEPGEFQGEYGLPAKGKTKYAYSGVSSNFIGGVEQSGYSSQINNTNAFLSGFYRSPFLGPAQVSSVWGRVRLLSGPLPSSDNVVAAITNPSGTITTSTFSSVGQVVDYVLGPEIRLHQWDRADGNTDRVSFIVGFGATTPVSSNQLQLNFQAPTVNSQQCYQLVAQYPTIFSRGSGPGGSCTLTTIVPGQASGQTVSTISFDSEDRTNFLMKYGGGIRLAHVYPAKGQQPAYAGTFDMTIGQDQAITGGSYRGLVFRVDGVYPLALGGSSFLYLFGSASMKSSRNENSASIILSPATTPALPLPATAVVLPQSQPNRDFYRFGVGLNLTAIFCKLSPSGCSTNASSQSSGSGSSTALSGTTPSASAKD